MSHGVMMSVFFESSLFLTWDFILPTISMIYNPPLASSDKLSYYTDLI